MYVPRRFMGHLKLLTAVLHYRSIPTPHGQTVRKKIRSDIRKVTDVLVELSVQ